MTLIIIGSLIIATPIVLMFLKYGMDDPHESLDRWLFDMSLERILRTQVMVRFGLVVVAYGLFRVLAW